MITAYATGTLSTTGSGTEDFLSSPNVQGKYRLMLDLNDMAAGDVVEVRVYKMVLTGGTQRVHQFTAYYGAQPSYALIALPFDEVWNELTDANAVRFSITQTFGTAGISIPWVVLKDDALTPTTTARTLDVSSGGEAGLDWANIGSPTTAQNLSGTNIDVDQVVASVSGAVGSVTGAVGSVTGAVGSVTGNVGGNVVGSVASVTGAVGSVTGNVGGNVAGSVASVTGAVGSVTGAVGSVTGNVGGNVTGSVGSVAAGGITAASVATGAIDADALAADVITDIWQGTALTEAYAADGATATPAQLLYMIWSALSEFAISSTTITAKKLDGSTTSMTFTLDDATNPTSRTRAT